MTSQLNPTVAAAAAGATASVPEPVVMIAYRAGPPYGPCVLTCPKDHFLIWGSSIRDGDHICKARTLSPSCPNLPSPSCPNLPSLLFAFRNCLPHKTTDSFLLRA
jgi:hypothetical protein